VLSISRTIDAVRSRICLRSAMRIAARRSSARDQDTRGLRQNQREQEERDQLAREPLRPEAAKHGEQGPHRRSTSAASM
jgi:hypothetical protein